MTPIGLFYGTNTGFTMLVAELIVKEFNEVAPNLVTVYEVDRENLKQMQAYDYLIVGCPTWNVGQLQDDWDALYTQIDDLI